MTDHFIMTIDHDRTTSDDDMHTIDYTTFMSDQLLPMVLRRSSDNTEAGT